MEKAPKTQKEACLCCGEMIEIYIEAMILGAVEFEGQSGEAKKAGQPKDRPADWEKPVEFESSA